MKIRRRFASWWKNNRGYIEGRVWIGGKWIHVKQHRWIMELFLGYPVPRSVDVHHINGNRQDNRIENLEMIPHGEHTTRTSKNRVFKKGYKLDLPKAERKARSERAKEFNLAARGREAIRNKRCLTGGV